MSNIIYENAEGAESALEMQNSSSFFENPITVLSKIKTLFLELDYINKLMNDANDSVSISIWKSMHNDRIQTILDLNYKYIKLCNEVLIPAPY